MDQHALTLRQMRMIKEDLPDRQRGKWDGRSLHVLECPWLRRQISGENRNILRGAAISTEGGQRIDRVANQHIADAARHAFDDARNLVTRYSRQALRPIAIPVCF